MALRWLQDHLGIGDTEDPAPVIDHGGDRHDTAGGPATKRVRTEEPVEPQVPFHP